jgi:hypothetical protein
MEKKHYEITALVICVLLTAALSGCKKDKPDTENNLSAVEDKLTSSERESLKEVNKIIEKTNTKRAEYKGIPFDDFWAKVKQYGEKWAGDKFYVSNIEAGNVIGFDRHGGLAASWEADIIKCEEIKSSDKYTTCKGIKKIITMSEKSKTGDLIIKDDPFPFYGSAFDPKKVKIGPEEAEKTANKHKGYTPKGFENYDYELKPDKSLGDVPVWHIGKRVNIKQVLKDKKATSDNWNVKVNAESGQVIE